LLKFSKHFGVQRAWGILSLLLCLLPIRAQVSREEDLKAALIVSFVRFTEWPAAEAPITVGIMNQPELLAAAASLSQGKSVLGRAIQVRGLKYASDLNQCQVVYFGGLQGKKLDELLVPAQELNLLTIGESDKFLDAGGSIHIFLEDGRLNFEVNLTTLAQSKLSISSKLLRLGYTRRESKSPKQGRTRP